MSTADDFELVLVEGGHKPHHQAFAMERKDALIMKALHVPFWLESLTERMAIGENNCLDWVGGLDSGGYPEAHLPAEIHPNMTVKVHRAIWLEMMGPIPFGLVIHHRCHNRTCCQIMHLEVTTMAANNRDRVPGPPSTSPDPNRLYLFEMPR